MAKRPRRNSKSRSAVRPPVIDVKAEAAEPDDDAPPAPEKLKTTETADAEVEADVTATDDTPTAAETAEAAPVHDEQPAATLHDGRKKWIAAGLVAMVVAAAGLGAWLYRDYGARVFGASLMADLSAVEQRVGGIEAAVKSHADKLAEVTRSLGAVREKMTALEADSATRQTAGEQSLAAVQKTVEELRAALSAAAVSGEGGTAGQAANRIELEKLAAKVNGVSERIAKAEKALKKAAAPIDPAVISALQGKLATIEQTIGALEESQSALATQTSSNLGQAFAKLSSKLASSDPFGAELDALAIEAPAVPGIDVLRLMSTTGVMSHGDLAARLDKMVAELGKAQQSTADRQNSKDGLMGALKSKLNTIVKIRKIDEADWPAVLSTAAAQIRDGQLQQALSFIAAQPGAAPDELAAWMKSAENRVKADKALQQLSQAVLRRLAASSQNG